jgi:hypothetical protein
MKTRLKARGRFLRPVTLFNRQWFPIAKTLKQTCCRCGLKHEWKLRVRRGGYIELMLK